MVNYIKKKISNLLSNRKADKRFKEIVQRDVLSELEIDLDKELAELKSLSQTNIMELKEDQNWEVLSAKIQVAQKAMRIINYLSY